MKKIYKTLAILIAALLLISCGNKDVNAIIKAQKASREKLEVEWKKFADDFFMYSALRDSGSSGYDISIKNWQSTKDAMPKFIEQCIANNIGLKFDSVNDKKNKEFRYSYVLKNILKGQPETTIANVKVGNTNIEAASPEILGKTFTIKTSDVGKLGALVLPLMAFPMLSIDLSYDNLKKMNFFELDKVTIKRLEKATRNFYSKAKISKTDSGYIIESGAENVKNYQTEVFNTLYKDSHITALIELYKKLLPAENFNTIQTKLADLLNNLPKVTKLTEEMIITKGFITKSTTKCEYETGKTYEFGYEIADYEHPLNSCLLKMSIPLDVDGSSEYYNISFGSQGTCEKDKADLWFFTDLSNKKTAETFALNFNFAADATKTSDNFRALMTIVGSNPLAKSKSESQPDTVGVPSMVSLSVDGSMKKTSDDITYTIGSIALNNQPNDAPADTNLIELEGSYYMSKKVPESFKLPEEKLEILNITPSGWKTLQDEVLQNIENLAQKLNLN